MGLSASAELLVLSAFVILAINRSCDGLMAGEAGWKVTVPYCRVYGFGHLRADCQGPLGSAPEDYASFEYGTTLPYLTLPL